MTAANDRWAKYGKLGAVIAFVVAVVVGAANLDGFLSMIERFTDSSASSTKNAGAPPTINSAPGATAAPNTSETPIAPDRQDSTPTVQAAPRQTATPQRPPTTAAALPKRAGALVITIKMGSGGKVGPSEYRTGAQPGANVDVYDDIGQLSSGCYPSWVLTRAGAEVQKTRNGRCTSGGITMFNFGDSLDTPGTYRLNVDVVTDSGQTGSNAVEFVVR
ncbi:hypothetical protein SK803_18900 [Lentzea sp. BCCO 10_0856]|uniref:Uncharacterized protein n=1 Tax=Lentzea miocenica TaxID=3095431 RepID=A0ABU4T2G1_9PSEU|nr:hypothetical protein [Lentzea sp. BCCO 10_0856]MDX8032290.1 hypothetical protein [Lentzea sp. BCCO 10_0856]